VEDDDVISLQKYLSNIHNVETKTAALLSAVRSARYRCITLLMENGCDPLLTLDGTSAVHCAVTKPDMKALLLLVGQPSLIAVNTKPVEVSNGGEQSWCDEQRPVDEALFIAAGLGSVEAVDLLLECGANPNCCFYYDDEFLVLCSTLVAACLAPLRHIAPDNAVSGADDVIQALVNSGANVQRRCSTGMMPLHWVVRAGLMRSLTLLVKSGADVDAKRASDGKTPLMMAAESSVASVATLLGAGAAIDATDHARFTALCHAVNADNQATAEYLLQRGANPNGSPTITALIPFLTTTPLYLATSMGSRALVVLLLKWGATLHESVGKIPSRATVFQVALCVSNFELVGVFLAAGVDPTYASKLVCEHIEDICSKVPPGMNHLLPVDDRVRLQSLQKLHVELSQPQMLKLLCRLAIRHYASGHRQLCKLPLPSALCSFLSFGDL